MLMVIQPAWYGDPARGSHLGSLYAGIVPHFSTILHWTRLSFAKHGLYQYRGVSRSNFPLYLKEMEYRFNHRQENLLKHFIRLYFGYVSD